MLRDSLTIHLQLTSAGLCTKQEKLWILSSISYSVVCWCLTAGMKRGIMTLSAYRQCHMWVLFEETLEGIWTSQQQQQSRLFTSCITFAPVVSLCILIPSVFSLSSISAIFQEIFWTVWFWVNIFFSCLLLFCFVRIWYQKTECKKKKENKTKRIIITLCFLYWLRETVGGCWWCVLIYDRLSRISFEDVVF